MSPRIQVLLDQATLPPVAVKALRKLGAEIELSSLERNDRPRGDTPIDARLIVTADGDTLRTDRRAVLMACCETSNCGTLILSLKELSSDQPLVPELLERGVTLLHNPMEEELSAHLSVLAGMRGPIGVMRRELTAMRERETRYLTQTRKYEDQQRMAAITQRELLSSSAPVMKSAEWRTIFQPAEAVSGDLYELTRIDDERVAMMLLDATGHGLTAALLAAHGRRAVQDASLARGDLDDLSATILRRMNDEVLGANLSECPFISALHAVFNERTREISWARGGGGYPILIRANHPPVFLRSAGPLVGINREAEFETARLQMEPGDTLLFYTDGLDALLREQGETISGDLSACAWILELTAETLRTRLAALETTVEDMHGAGVQPDDLTVIALHLPAETYALDDAGTEPAPALVATYL